MKPQLFSLDLASNENLVLSLKTPVEIQNIISEQDADILFFDLSNTLPGQSPDVIVHRTYSSPDSLRILPGEYDITIYPVGDDSENYPVEHFKGVTIGSEGVVSQVGEVIELGMMEGGQQWSGRIFYSNGVDNSVPALAMTAQAFDANGTLILSRPFEAKCDEFATGDCNLIKIPLSKQTRTMELHLFKPDEPFFPTYRYYIADVASNSISSAAVASSSISSAAVIELPPHGTPVEVFGKVFTNNGSPPPKCRVLFEMPYDEPEKDKEKEKINKEPQLTYWVETDQYGELERFEGAAGVYLYPGKYRVKVYPIQSATNTSQRYAYTELPLVVPAPGDNSASENSGNPVNFEVALQNRRHITGTVIYNAETEADTDDDVLIPSVSLNAYAIGSAHPFTRVRGTLSRQNGNYQIWMDNTQYYVIAVPPLESGFAAGVELYKLAALENSVINISVQTPFVIAGKIVEETTVVDTDGGPGPKTDTTSDSTGASAIAGTPEIASSQISMEWYLDFGNSAYLVARTSVDEDYTFTALLPSN
ncbi:MAG: hypothetical protein JXR76_05440 [Deltaproteobacteria bacterium]|nr:hypothetical protein [Deltaproteobacteria bacterium]